MLEDERILQEEERQYQARREARRRQRLREQMKRKQRQIMIRKITRLGAVFVAAILVVTLVVQLVAKPIMKKSGSGENANVVQVQAEPKKTDTVMAKRIPVKDESNIAKAAVKTVGWQTDDEGSWYQNADGSYYADGIFEVDGDTYFLDEKGYKQSGWVTVDGRDRFFEEDGTENASKKRKMVALTFDDEPGQYTQKLLDCLEQYDAKATFFMLGENAELYPDEIKKMKEIGCELGNHSYSHPQLTALDSSEISAQFEKTNDIIEAACGSPATVARTPFGAQDESVLSNIGLPCFMWNIDTLDWQTKDVENTYNVTMDNVTDGDIVLMHDIHEATVDAALKLIPALVEQGYKLVTISELAAQKGITLEDGVSYTDFCDATVAEMQIAEEDSEEDYQEEDESEGNDESEEYASEESDTGNSEEEEESEEPEEEYYGEDF